MLLGGFFSLYPGEQQEFANPIGIDGFRYAPLNDAMLVGTWYPSRWWEQRRSWPVSASRPVIDVSNSRGFSFAASLVAAGYLLLQAAWTLSGVFDIDFTGLSVVILTICFVTIPVASG